MATATTASSTTSTGRATATPRRPDAGAEHARRPRAVRYLRWALAALFLVAGGSKLLGLDSSRSMFEEFGYSQTFRFVVGVLETAGAIGLLVPRFVFWAALGLGGIMAGATGSHLANDPVYAALSPLAVLAVLVWIVRAHR